MAILSDVVDANGWAFVRGVTGPDSYDPLGLAANSNRLVDPGGAGAHFAGGYRTGRTSVILKAFYDAYRGGDLPIGYIETVQTFCLGRPVDPRLFPGLNRKLDYTEPGKTSFLDFMGAVDARARFGGRNLAGDAPADAPFRPFDVFLRSPENQYDAIWWHPLPYGSMRPRNGFTPNANTKPTWDGVSREVSKAASLRTVVTPFLLGEELLAPLCTETNLTYRWNFAASDADAASLYDLVRRIYLDEDKLNEGAFANIVDAVAAGPFLVLVTESYDAIVATIGDRAGAPGSETRAVRLWEIDHDTYESLEHAAALETLNRLDGFRAETMPSALPGVTPVPQGRGWSGTAATPAIAYAGGPTFSLVFTATAVRWLPKLPRLRPRTQAQYLSSFQTRVDWTYDRTAEDFDVTITRPVLIEGLDPCAPALWTRYQDVLYDQTQPAGAADPAPFYLAGAPWLDDAPTYAPMNDQP